MLSGISDVSSHLSALLCTGDDFFSQDKVSLGGLNLIFSL